METYRRILVVVALFLLFSTTTIAQATAFRYQGRLIDAGSAPTGQYDFTLRLFENASGLPQVGGVVSVNDVQVTAGVFTVTLDSGSSPFTSNTGNFLEISVRPGTITGFGAEDIAKIDPRFATYNSSGLIEGVKYDRLTVAFVNAFKEQQVAIDTLKNELADNKLREKAVARRYRITENDILFNQTVRENLSKQRGPLPYRGRGGRRGRVAACDL